MYVTPIGFGLGHRKSKGNSPVGRSLQAGVFICDPDSSGVIYTYYLQPETENFMNHSFHRHRVFPLKVYLYTDEFCSKNSINRKAIFEYMNT